MTKPSTTPRRAQSTHTVFGAPGNATDFVLIAHQLEAWDAYMRALMQSQHDEVQTELGAPHLANAFSVDPLQGGEPVAITWNGFPKKIADQYVGDERYIQAENPRPIPDYDNIVARPQDEYLEWHVTTGADNASIVAVDFTCEGPEYWQALADGYPKDILDPAGRAPDGFPPAHGSHAVLLRLYQKYVSPDVQLKDLLSENQKYNPLNEWNLARGAMHLTHPANTLGAEVNLAARASIIREKNGHVLVDSQELINCAEYGDPSRSSDPNIGAAVNAAVRTGDQVTLRAPVGLYIDSLDMDGWLRPDGTPIDQSWWMIERGTADMILRARFQVPAHLGFSVSDLTIGGEPIRYGGQIAERITMKLYGMTKAGFDPAPPIGCKTLGQNAKPPAGGLPAAAHIADQEQEAVQVRTARRA